MNPIFKNFGRLRRPGEGKLCTLLHKVSLQGGEWFLNRQEGGSPPLPPPSAHVCVREMRVPYYYFPLFGTFHEVNYSMYRQFRSSSARPAAVVLNEKEKRGYGFVFVFFSSSSSR